MRNIWKERERALENEYFYRQEKEKIDRLRQDHREQLIKELCQNRCPKCGQAIQAVTFRGVPLDQCPDCGGIWLGPNDLATLAQKDHRTWFDKWFRAQKEAGNSEEQA